MTLLISERISLNLPKSVGGEGSPPGPLTPPGTIPGCRLGALVHHQHRRPCSISSVEPRFPSMFPPSTFEILRGKKELSNNSRLVLGSSIVVISYNISYVR